MKYSQNQFATPPIAAAQMSSELQTNSRKEGAYLVT